MAISPSPTINDASFSIHNMEAMKTTRRRPIVTDSDSHSSSNSSNDTNSSRNSRRRRRPQGKKQRMHQDPVDRALSEMTITPQEQDQYVALDCEMVGVGPGGRQSALARVTMVDWNHSVLLDELVQPDQEITDYRTFVSGITPELLEQSQTLDFETCRQKVLALLQGKILVGHGLKNDLRALQITLPWYTVRDTAKYEPFEKARFDDGILWPQSLKTLAESRLHRQIQTPGQAHCPVEDAATAMDLYKVARVKWEKAMDYKMKKTREIQQKQQQQQLKQ